MNKPSYVKQNCDLLLSDGLKEYYLSNPLQVKEFADRFGKLLVNHDITHVVFGLGTSIEEETLLDTWTLRGTNITWKQIYQYSTNLELKELTKIIVKDNGGWKNIFKVVIKCLPLKLKIHFNRIPKMKKKWPFSNVSDDMMNTSISDLRKEYGIKVIQVNS